MDIPIYLPTTKVFVQTFFLKKYGWRTPYLPTVWTYVQTFVVFSLDPLLTMSWWLDLLQSSKIVNLLPCNVTVSLEKSLLGQ